MKLFKIYVYARINHTNYGMLMITANCSLYCIVLQFILLRQSCGLVSDEISFLVLSQKYHSRNAQGLKAAIIEQSLNLDDGSPANVYLSHEVFKKSNDWTITPVLIDILNQLIKPQTKWFVLCEANSVVNLKKLLLSLENEDETKETYLGFQLKDKDATIIHHFAFFNNPSIFHYPYFRAGVAFSIPILNRLVDRLLPSTMSPFKPQTDFSIDSAHEFAFFIHTVDKNLKLRSVPYFCSRFNSECAIWAREENIYCGNPISLDKVLFAVKTCEKYHKERLPIILSTWAQFTIHLRIFSDAEDTTIPTISTKVPNEERGHCEKSLKILRLVLDEIARNYTLRNVEYVILLDDDTLLSPSSLSEYLGCYDSNDFIYLGERYGYDLFAEDSGYNYITGGGGIVFNLKTVKKIVDSCFCPDPSSPDDMILGNCLKQFGIEPIHSNLFHQARSKDYPKATLSSRSISFHKFWQIDPIEEYSRWFRARDEEYFAINKHLHFQSKYEGKKCVSNSDECFHQRSNQNDINRIEL